MTARPRFRVIDTGLRGGRANVAFDRALIEARRSRLIPDTIRFLRFTPSALVGIHQIAGHEVRLDYCRRHGIEVGRRITGGGALYLDPGQIGWELVFERGALPGGDLAHLSRRLCEAAALGLSRLGVAAAFRPRNDIEVEGRKISGTGGFFEGSTFFFQGTLLVDFDVETMIAALRVPVEKLARRDLDSARQRVVSLRELLGRVPPLAEIEAALLQGFAEGLGIELVRGEVGAEEERLAEQIFRDEIGTDDFVEALAAPDADETLVSASLVKRGGSLRADIRLEGPGRGRIREALITGDFLLTPPRALLDLEASLRGVETSEAGAAVEDFFTRSGAELVNLAPADLREVVEAALRQLSLSVLGRLIRGHMIGPGPAAAPTLVFLHDALGCSRLWRDFPERLARATGCGALLFDRWGSGDSAPLAPPFRRDYLLEEALHALPAVLDAAGVRRAILVGHSDGATIALAFAGAHPERVQAVIAESPHLWREEKTLAAIREQIADFEQGDLKARLARYHGARTEALFGRLVEVWTTSGERGWGIDDYVAAISCPVLAIRGADDEFFSEAQTRRIDELVPGGIECLAIAGCRHAPHREAFKPTIGAMARFVARVIGPPREAGAALRAPDA